MSAGIRRHYVNVLNTIYGGGGRGFINRVIDSLDRLWDSVNVFLIEAPTGYGKTAISLAIARRAALSIPQLMGW